MAIDGVETTGELGISWLDLVSGESELACGFCSSSNLLSDWVTKEVESGRLSLVRGTESATGALECPSLKKWKIKHSTMNAMIAARRRLRFIVFEMNAQP
jgi:hypothetical protein